jgi:hypothetical protein
MRGRKLNTDVFDLGESPVIFQPTKQDGCYCICDDREAKVVSVAVPGCTYYNSSVSTIVSGLDCNGKQIYSYEKTDETGKTETCQCDEKTSQEGINVLRGVKYPISSNPVMYKGVTFSTIDNIIKEPTVVPVEYRFVDRHGRAYLMARLEPHQIISRYRRYRLPQSCCKKKCILGLFKVSKPDRIIDRNQVMLSSNEQAIISMAIGMDEKYNNKDMNKGLAYIAEGIGHLNAELRESQSASQQPPLQVDMYDSYDKIVPMM